MNVKTVSVISVAVACAAAAAVSCIRFVNRAAADRRAYEERLMAIGFDDFRGSDFTFIHPLFQKYGANATYNFPPFTTACEDKWRKRCAMLENAGSEIGDHTWWHWNNTYDDPRSNGQDPAHPDGNQVPFPSNDQMRKDRGDGKNVFGFGLEAPTGNRIKTYDYGKSDWKLKAAATPWGQLTDEECQEIRDHFAVYGNAFGMLDRLDELSNRYLGTTGKSRGSWDAKKGCYTGGVFTGCRTSANHEIWERTLELMRAYMRDLHRKDFAFETWSWPGRYNSPFLFRKNKRTYFDEQCTKPANALSRFESSRLLGTDGKPLNRSWTEALRAFGYKTTHDMTHPSRRDGLPLTMMRRQLFKNASYSRIDALAYSTDTTIDYGVIPREYPETYFTNTTSKAAQMYDGKGSFRRFAEAMRHDTAQGLVMGEVIDSEDTYSERAILEETLKYANAMGIRTVAKRDAFRACFGRTCVYGNLIRNTAFRNSAKEFFKDAATVPENPDGYVGKCRVNEGPNGRTLVTEGETVNLLFGVPTGELEYSVKAKGSGKIRIMAVKNSTLATLKDAEPLAEVEVKDGVAKVRFAVPDNPATDYEPQWEGLGNKVMALQFVYPAGLEISEVRLEKPSFANWLLGLCGVE